MREAAERRKELELERQEAQAQLREKQDEIKQLHKVSLTSGQRNHCVCKTAIGRFIDQREVNSVTVGKLPQHVCGSFKIHL